MNGLKRGAHFWRMHARNILWRTGIQELHDLAFPTIDSTPGDIIAGVLSWMGLAAGQLVVLLQCICCASIVTWVQTNHWQT
jgi:hypothetical protein